MPKEIVSVITPLYNTDKFIAETIESVLRQTFVDWEMIIVDDCSRDQSFEIANRYAEKDCRIKVFQLPHNSGPATARNKGIEAASGKYIAFLDSDDLWSHKKLEKQIQFMKENRFKFTYTCYEIIDQEGYPTGESVHPDKKLEYRDLLRTNQIGCLTAIYDAEQIGKVYMPEILKRQDYALWLKILKKHGKAYCLNESLACYRKRSTSISSNKFNLLKFNWKLFREIEGLTKVESIYYLALNILNKVFSS